MEPSDSCVEVPTNSTNSDEEMCVKEEIECPGYELEEVQMETQNLKENDPSIVKIEFEVWNNLK